MIYLMDTQGEGNLFLYDSETDHFSAFEKIDLSSDSYILITDDKESANIPEDYEETTIQINGKVFPAWQNVVDTKLADFCLVYAVDNAGKKGYTSTTAHRRPTRDFFLQRQKKRNKMVLLQIR